MDYIHYNCCDHCCIENPYDDRSECLDELLWGGHRRPCPEMCGLGRTPVSFIASVRRGHANLEDVDDWVDWWHTHVIPVSLDEFLGLSPEEGARFAENPNTIKELI